MRKAVMTLAAILVAGTAAAESHMTGPATTYTFDGSFEDAAFALENAIVGKGLVVDYVTHTGDMLARTGEDVGSDVKLFEAADVYLFCSAVVSRKVMEANPMNLAFCPYGIFVAERDGEVMLGYQNYPDGEMQEVQSMLDDIVQDALGN